MHLLLWLFSLSFILKLTTSELYTALVDLKEVLHTESILINSLDQYIQAEQKKLELLQKYLEIYKRQHTEASEDVETYIANPINAYLLIKRLTTDWQHVETLMNMHMGHDYLKNVSMYREYMKFPTDEDLNGAAVALTRLQDTYNLDTAALARGELNGIKYSSELSAADCFELGRQSYNNGDFYHTQLWMREADARLNSETNKTVEKSDILEYLAFSTYKQGNLPLALDLTNKLLDIFPAHPRALGNKGFYEEELQKLNELRIKGDDESEDIPVNNEMMPQAQYPERELYEQLCRGEVKTDIAITSQLKCYYANNNNPFLLIAPFKVEEAYPSPKILIFHDVMSDNEIETVKSMAKPRFKRATVQNYKTGELETAQYRISKSAWLKDKEHKHIGDICRRVRDMTGLTVETAEELQVVNYGIGGHYEPHFDFARKEETNAFKSLGTGNRIATVLFYMSDVPQGGATVFPNINAAIWPKKGTAAFWFNLHSSGEGDLNTRHAACPVLAGSKWVSNKWIHEQGQEFLRPCGLEQAPPELTA